MDDPWVIGTVLTLGFSVVFAGIWFLVTKLIVRMSGWPRLEESFPDQSRDQATEKWSFASGALGRSAITAVNFRNSLVVEACQSGLRVKIWRILAPFSDPIFIPWSQMRTEKAALGTVLLILGEPEQGCLRVYSKFARKIEAASLGKFAMVDE